jgi:hypothetical protein
MVHSACRCRGRQVRRGRGCPDALPRCPTCEPVFSFRRDGGLHRFETAATRGPLARGSLAGGAHDTRLACGRGPHPSDALMSVSRAPAIAAGTPAPANCKCTLTLGTRVGPCFEPIALESPAGLPGGASTALHPRGAVSAPRRAGHAKQGPEHHHARGQGPLRRCQQVHGVLWQGKGRRERHRLRPRCGQTSLRRDEGGIQSRRAVIPVLVAGHPRHRNARSVAGEPSGDPLVDWLPALVSLRTLAEGSGCPANCRVAELEERAWARWLPPLEGSPSRVSRKPAARVIVASDAVAAILCNPRRRGRAAKRAWTWRSAGRSPTCRKSVPGQSGHGRRVAGSRRSG